MQEQKTIREWYQMLPSPYREQAIENATERGHIDVETDSLRKAIEGGFRWAATQEKGQGIEYWIALYEKALNDNLQNINPNRKPGGIVKSYTFEGTDLSMMLKECVLQGKEKPISDFPEMITISDLPLIHSTKYNTTIYAHKAK